MAAIQRRRERVTRGRAPTAPPLGLLLAPGAGADRNHSALVAIDEAASAGGIVVRRIDFPYRLAGRRAPDHPAVLVATIADAAESLAGELGTGTDHLALGGRSMGGRMCTMAVAEGLAAAALVLVSYPLHPPGKPERQRMEHLGRICVPCLFVSGTNDAFGSPEELESATRTIRGPVTHRWLDKGDHGLRRRDREVAGIVSRWLGSLREEAGAGG